MRNKVGDYRPNYYRFIKFCFVYLISLVVKLFWMRGRHALRKGLITLDIEADITYVRSGQLIHI